MTPERWKQVDELLNSAMELDPDKRPAFLNEACGEDEELRKEVESLLAADEKDQNHIEKYPMQLAADLVAQHHAGLVSGNFIGPYKILSMIGSGGMGEVYRASDSRIGREVAVKILPSHFSHDPDRLRRFEQEARAAGMLNHPNVVAIHDAGTFNGSPYLVSELLQGEVLQQKLKGQPLPVRKAVDYAIQIAKGLSSAHEKGIIHRDLKPGNIFLTREGRVKVLDFGLAKLTHPDAPISTSNQPENIDQTDTGIVLGTVVYMSPEQVTGRKVDHRSDIFAFGSVLYEMLAGRRPFGGDTQIEIMHAILKADPPELSQSNGNIPPSLERIVRRCLEKDPDHRFQNTSDLAFALESLSSTSGTAVVPLRQKKPLQLAWILSGILFLAATILGVALYRSLNRTAPESSSSAQQLSIVLPPNTVLNSSAISPDGQRLAYAINGTTGFSKLWLRSMDSTQAQEIPDTEDATLPFWSPDSRSIGFFTETELKKWTIGGGPPETLCEVDLPKGGTWNQYGDILFASQGPRSIYRISARGGEPTPASTLDESRNEARHSFPQFLPDGRHFFYMLRGAKGVYIASLDSKDRKLILPESIPVRFVDPGYLFFSRSGKLMVQRFDTNRMELTGEAIPITDNWSGHVSGPNFSVSENNVLINGGGDDWASQPIWFDRSGKQSSPLKGYPSTIGEPGGYWFCDLSSDDKHLLTIWKGAMWMVELVSGSFTRFAMTNESEAVFSPDGSQVIYKDVGLYRRSSSGSGKVELLSESSGEDLNWSADGRFLTFTAGNPKTLFNLWVLPLNGERKAFPFLQTETREENPVLSPDGKWVAFQSYQSGRSEVYVRSFPVEAAGVWAISTDGGEKPIWRRDGKELFYLTLDKKLMAVEVQTGEVFKVGTSRFLFQTHAQPRINTWGIGKGKQYFVSSNGTHFLVNTLIDNPTPSEINVLLNWKSLLKR
jgi:eukaryotic-like serine/threonine-protein kinase